MYPLVFEFVLVIIFYITIIRQGPRSGVKTLVTIFLIIVLFSFLSISRAVYWSLTPIGPPPIHFDEGYYDGLVARSIDNSIAIHHSFLLLLLSTSYVLAKARIQDKNR
ncbi:MAG: hypothetical protein RTV41_04720 [Candidatus Thorarchaeota archaeon]